MDRLLCSTCKTSLSQEPPVATDEGISIDRPANLIDVRCCNSICGHLAHSECLLRSLAVNPTAGCPTCQRQIRREELYPIRPLLEAAAPSGSAPLNGSGDAPGGTESSSALESRARTASTAFGLGSNSDPKLPRTTNPSPSSVTSASSSTGSSAGSPPPPPGYRTQILVALLGSCGMDVRAVFTPEICRQCDEKLERIDQAITEAGINTDSIVENARGIHTRIQRLGEQFHRSDQQQQQQLLERVFTTLVNAFLDADTNRIRDRLATLERDLADMVEWWDRQNF